MRKQLVLWLLAAFTLNSNAQVITVEDKETNEPLEMVTLVSQQPQAFAVTNKQGQAEISVFKETELIEFRLIGYKPLSMNYYGILEGSNVVHMQPTRINLDEAVVSATRWNQNTSEIPHKVTSISSKAIRLHNPQTAADMLGASGEVFIQKSQQGGGSPMIRGFATNRLLYSIDGVRMNNAIFRGGNIQNVISLDPFAMEQTEILFGPGSVIYGSDAIGGVMSFQTITPQFAYTNKELLSGKALARYASANNERTGHFHMNIGKRKWASVTSISSNEFGNLKMGSHGPDEYLRELYVERQNNMDVAIANDEPQVQQPSGYSQINLMQKLRYKSNTFWDIEYGFHYSETSNYARYDRHIRLKNGKPRYGEWYYGPQKWMMNNLTVTNNRNNIFYDQLTLRFAQQFFEESRHSRDFNQPDKEIRIEKVDAYSANVDFHKSMTKKNQIFYGFEAVLNDVNSTGINKNILTETSEPGPSRYPESVWSSYGIYFTGQHNLSDALTLQAGLRYNQYVISADFDTSFYPFPFKEASINNGALTGSLGLVYRPADKWVISANAATAFRSPNVDDIGKVFDSEPGAVVVPNPDLEAEYAYNADVSIVKVFGDLLKVDLTGYYTILENAMVRRDYHMNGMDSMMYDGELSRIQAIQNAAVAKVYGIQTGIEVKLPADFNFSSDFNFQKGEEELDDGTTSPTRHAAPWFGVSRLTYSINKLNLQLNAVYSGEKKFEDMPEEEKEKDYMYAVDENGNPYSPGWYTLNLKAMYAFAENLEVSAGLENITDQRYRPYSSGIVAPGRNFIISLQAVF